MGCHCHNNCQEVLKKIHVLFKEASTLSAAADAKSLEAIHELKETIVAVKESTLLENKALLRVEEARKVLAESGCQFGCALDDCECQCILQKALNYAEKDSELESEALHELECALDKLEKAYAYDVKVAELFRRYTDCIHQPFCK